MRKARPKSTTRASPKSPKPLSPGRSYTELYAMGKALRDRCPRTSHAKWVAPRTRPDPLGLILASDKGRIPELVPIRHGRMLRSPFTLYRGAALNMAADLARTPATGLRVQACGDCHLCNFGAFATPERRVIFDINDLDETLPAPWEWDVKRLAASIVLACRSNGFSKARCEGRRAGLRADLSRAHGGIQPDARPGRLVCQHRRREDHGDRRGQGGAPAATEAAGRRPRAQRGGARLSQARRPGQGQEPDDQGQPAAHLPPAGGGRGGHDDAGPRGLRRSTGRRMQADRRVLLDRFELKDMAIKVVGVGSVGTYCAVLLLMASESRPALPPGQGGAAAPSWSRMPGQALYRQSRPAGRQRDPAHAIGQRHLPRLGRRASSAAISMCASSGT